jgi:hypothetical protein
MLWMSRFANILLMQPIVQITPGWKFLHACTGGEDCRIAEIAVWAHKWRQNPFRANYCQRPASRADFRFDVYEISVGSQRAVSAAGEFSNGVFGFYVPTH